MGVQLETDKYDMEQKKVNQVVDLKELKERQKAQLRQKALKKGLDPEALTGNHPPMIRMYSKYERRTDTRTYDDRKKLYEGGWEVLRMAHLDEMWKEKYDEWTKRPSKKRPSGLVSDQVRRLVIQKALRERRREKVWLHQRKRKKKKKSKHCFSANKNSLIFA